MEVMEVMEHHLVPEEQEEHQVQVGLAQLVL
jgi:hypothetical protein